METILRVACKQKTRRLPVWTRAFSIKACRLTTGLKVNQGEREEPVRRPEHLYARRSKKGCFVASKLNGQVSWLRNVLDMSMKAALDLRFSLRLHSITVARPRGILTRFPTIPAYSQLFRERGTPGRLAIKRACGNLLVSLVDAPDVITRLR
jgi:hypothetical protein